MSLDSYRINPLSGGNKNEHTHMRIVFRSGGRKPLDEVYSYRSHKRFIVRLRRKTNMTYLTIVINSKKKKNASELRDVLVDVV